MSMGSSATQFRQSAIKWSCLLDLEPDVTCDLAEIGLWSVEAESRLVLFGGINGK